jgi:hypothetical protein
MDQHGAREPFQCAVGEWAEFGVSREVINCIEKSS